MSLTKMVNGIQVACTPEEEASIKAEWQANDLAASIAALQPKPTAADSILKDPAALDALKAALAK